MVPRRSTIEHTGRHAGAGIEPSVGTVGDSDQDASAETIDGLFNSEVVKSEAILRRAPWRSIETVALPTPEGVDRSDHRRIPGPVGPIPPAEAGKRCRAILEQYETAP